MEKRLIQEFKKNPLHRARLANTSTDPGKTDGETSIAYAVYMTFTMATHTTHGICHVHRGGTTSSSQQCQSHSQYQIEALPIPETVWIFSSEHGDYRKSSVSKTSDEAKAEVMISSTEKTPIQCSSDSHHSGSTPSNKPAKRKRPNILDAALNPPKKIFLRNNSCYIIEC